MFSGARRWLGDQPVYPLGVLAGLNLVDEFDRIAFATLTPEIRDAFGSNDATINSIATLAAVSVLFTAAPIGRLADRVSRVKLSLVAALIWGICSALTGVVGTLALLIVVRVLSGIGRNANEIVHPSLLQDLYGQDSHPRVFLVHRLANPLAQASGILAGFAGAQFGWRWAFVLLAMPTLVLAALLPKVNDPERRGVAAATRDLSLRQTATELRAVPSLRKFWATAFFLAAAAIGIFQLISVYFDDEFGFGPAGRGATQFLVGLGWVIGVLIGAQAADRVPLERASVLAKICAGGFVVMAIGAVGMALSPTSAVALTMTTLMATGNGVWQAPYFTAVGRISPPGLSGQAYASATLFYALGALLSIPLFILGDQISYRVAFVCVAVLALIAGALARSTATVMEHDMARSLADQAARGQ